MLSFLRQAILLSPLCLSVLALSQQVTAPLSIVSGSLPTPLVHQQYQAQLQATGGIQPLRWQVSRGNLPQGLNLDESSGSISGTPEKAGEAEITISVIDSRGNTRSRDFKLKVVPPLLIEWSTFPRIQSDQILGSVKVSNGTKDTFDLTVIILAVNEYGKAFALGYQHFDLQPETVDVEIPFGEGSNLPVGAYIVHADAVAEVAAKDAIHRGRQQTPTRLVISPVP